VLGWALRIVGFALMAAIAFVAIGQHPPHASREAAAARQQSASMTDPAQTSSDGARRMGIRSNENGHFYVDARIAGRSVRFLVDTGASRVILAPQDAERLGLRPRPQDFTEAYRTANGIVRAAPVVLDEIRIGNLRVDRVSASITERPMEISLLGVSFLSRLASYAIRGDELVFSW
jgi:aspartyl protease family protein